MACLQKENGLKNWKKGLQLNYIEKICILITPSKITKDFYQNLDKVLSFKNVKFFQLRLKNISNFKLITICQKN